ncbi:hypothetical protein [Enterovibrio norvegicus]|uniref:hypothetical protein n=1 Tax=Enterovibrio norvegicus TaxID=188144 RepID=UPI000C81E65D|nr:hypothetical protein [Enterovibrio norvegicus]PMH70251.1 hypothetical protein BCU62_25195 [Enterovibrio norvegicus]
MSSAIECIFRSFEDDFSEIQELKCNEKMKINLYLCLIDGVSNFSVPNEKQNRNRFIKTVKKFGNWKDGELISINQLNEFINSDIQDMGELKELSSKKMQEFITARLYRDGVNMVDSGFSPISQVDILSSEFIDLWERQAGPNSNGRLNKAYINQFNHFSLLYEFRNNLVHRFQNCSGASHGIYKEPGYTAVNDLIEEDHNSHHVTLIYPIDFIEMLTVNIINNTKNSYIDNGVDILQYVTDSKLWRMK